MTTSATMAAVEARLRLADPTGVEELLEDLGASGALDPRLEARRATARATLAWLCSRPEKAWVAAQEAAASWRRLGETGEAATIRALGARTLLSVGNAENAMLEVMAARDEAIRADDARALLATTTAVGHVHYGIQRFDDALIHFERALHAARSLGDAIAEGGLLDAVACTHGSRAALAEFRHDEAARRQLLEEALRLWRDAIRIARDNGHRLNEAAAVANSAEALVMLGRADEALASLQAWPLDPEVDLDRIVWQHRDTEGVICIKLGRHAQAITHLAEALRHADGSAQQMVVHEHLADAFERDGDVASALMHYKEFHGCHRRVASEAAQRSASVASVLLATAEANAMAVTERARADGLEESNDRLARRADDLMQLSLEDPLTGLANRRMMDRMIAADARSLGVAMIDVDHFKRVNDGWSHSVGDDVLRRLARLMRDCCRASDTPIRCGGEEFAILLRQLDARGAIDASERIRRAIEGFDWGSVAKGLAVTVSIGVALACEGETTAAVLELADRRLYVAKSQGRNRVVGPTGSALEPSRPTVQSAAASPVDR